MTEVMLWVMYGITDALCGSHDVVCAMCCGGLDEEVMMWSRYDVLSGMLCYVVMM